MKRLRKSSVSTGSPPQEFEMQSGVNGADRKDGGVMARQRSVSNAGPSSSLSPTGENAFSNSTDLKRSNTTGKRISDGLKKRFGSIRRRKGIEAEA
jgi:hypothetical protein